MKKIKLLKKIIPISGLIILILYLIRTYLILPIFIPFSKELNLVDCGGIGFWVSCNYNARGWIVLSILVFILVSFVVDFLSSRKK